MLIDVLKELKQHILSGQSLPSPQVVAQFKVVWSQGYLRVLDPIWELYVPDEKIYTTQCDLKKNTVSEKLGLYIIINNIQTVFQILHDNVPVV